MPATETKPRSESILPVGPRLRGTEAGRCRSSGCPTGRTRPTQQALPVVEPAVPTSTAPLLHSSALPRRDGQGLRRRPRRSLSPPRRLDRMAASLLRSASPLLSLASVLCAAVPVGLSLPVRPRRPSRRSPGPGPTAPTTTAPLLRASVPPRRCTGTWPPTPPRLRCPPPRWRSPTRFRLDIFLEPLSYVASVHFAVGSAEGELLDFRLSRG